MLGDFKILEPFDTDAARSESIQADWMLDYAGKPSKLTEPYIDTWIARKAESKRTVQPHGVDTLGGFDFT